MNFNLPDTVTVSGTEYSIRTDFRVILEIFVMLDDPDLTDADKTEALIRMFYVRREASLSGRREASPEGERPPESVFARVLRIREKLRTGRKLEKYERTWYNKNRDLVHLKQKYSKSEEALVNEWTKIIEEEPNVSGSSSNKEEQRRE